MENEIRDLIFFAGASLTDNELRSFLNLIDKISKNLPNLARDTDSFNMTPEEAETIGVNLGYCVYEGTKHFFGVAQ